VQLASVHPLALPKAHARFVSGHRFSDADESSALVAPLGASAADPAQILIAPTSTDNLRLRSPENASSDSREYIQ
jgi:hypothetical protein